MKWILIGIFSAALMMSVMLSAGVEFIGSERQPPSTDALTTTLR